MHNSKFNQLDVVMNFLFKNALKPECIHQIMCWESTLQLFNKLSGNFLTMLFHRCHNFCIYMFYNKTRCPHMIYKCGSNILPNTNSNKTKWYVSIFKFVNQQKLAFSLVLGKHITLERGMEHVIFISFTKFYWFLIIKMFMIDNVPG